MSQEADPPAVEEPYAGAPALQTELSLLMDLMLDALTDRLTPSEQRAFLLRRAAANDRTALLVVGLASRRDDVEGCVADAERTARDLWAYDRKHGTGGEAADLPLPEDAAEGTAEGSARAYVRREYRAWSRQ
ncbi:hypothetical protein ACEZCY_34780 [Streptacidiphilus sp. N1-12]|uniref:Uncharacterized protein n=2 Tax=Streptacidiphilus alkalitolerans TaxID=3342712 RepID=A0ABV6VKU4_9ACTN